MRNLTFDNLKCYYWAFEAMRRDKFKCVDCKFDNINKLLVHHIDESRKKGWLNMNNDINNLLTLCRKCHAKRHHQLKDHPEIIEMRRMGMTFQEIGDKLHVSRQRVHQLYQKNLAHLTT